MDQEKLKRLVNTSGFPFQLAISNLIEKTKRRHGWGVFSSEHPWHNHETGRSSYVDLILEKNAQLMIVECKRVRDAQWIFLIPTKEKLLRRHASLWISYVKREKKRFGWWDLAIDPQSPESEFCVVRGQDKDSKPMLERIASELVEATESIALEELQFEKPDDLLDFRRLYYSVIITTAQLGICRFDPNDISVRNGDIANAEFESVPFVRFRKSLTTSLSPNIMPNNLREAAKARIRTVFIINALNVEEILRYWDVGNDGPWMNWM